MITLFLIVGVYLLLYILIVYVLIPTFISPLSKIPNAHFSSSFSPLWMLWKRYREEENRTIHEAHVKHGKIVRLGPNEVSINCVDDGIRTVYGFEKGDWYINQFQNYGVTNMFCMKRSKPHSVRKRMLSNVYSKSYLQSSPELQKASQSILLDRLLPIVDKSATQDEPVDVLELNFSSSMDFVTAFIFGLGNGANFLQEPKFRQEWLKSYISRRPYFFLDAELKTVTRLCQRLGFPLAPSWVGTATSVLEDWTLARCRAAATWSSSLPQTLSSTTTTTVTKTPALVYDHLAQSIRASTEKDKENKETPTSTDPLELQIASELHDHLIAGHETSAITLTYLMHELSRQPALQAALRAELLTLNPPLIYPPHPKSQSHPQDKTNNIPLPTHRDIDTLPLLNACLMETLRLHSAIPGPQPRSTPFPPVSVAGSPPLDPGTRISASAYSLHRNPEVFSDPEVWKPARWMETTGEEERREMMRWFWAFGSGGRMCVGRHFAVQGMKLQLTALYTNYTTSIVDDSGVKQLDAYTAGLEGHRLILRFQRAEGK